MSEIERLASRVTEFSAKTDFWNNGALLFLVMTVLAAVGIVTCQELAGIWRGTSGLQTIPSGKSKVTGFLSNRCHSRLHQSA